MKLLFITQKVDKNDDVLGFVHGWLSAFARQWDEILVICLQKGEYSLPANVRVFSLGKEVKKSRLQYIFRFFRYLIEERRNYDAVFVHMNPEYVILGGVLWRLWGKRIGFWYNHTYGTWQARLAMKIAHFIFHTSPYAFTAGTKKSYRMPAGIDTELFTADSKTKKRRSILYLGRIAPVKYIDILLKAAQELDKRGVDFALDVYGGYLPEHSEYFEKIQMLARPLKERVYFQGSVPNRETPGIYRSHKILVNLTPAGNYDKTVLEALACGTLAVVSSPAFKRDLPELLFFKECDPVNLTDTLERILKISGQEYKKLSENLRQYVENNHSLNLLSKKVVSHYVRD